MTHTAATHIQPVNISLLTLVTYLIICYLLFPPIAAKLDSNFQSTAALYGTKLESCFPFILILKSVTQQPHRHAKRVPSCLHSPILSLTLLRNIRRVPGDVMLRAKLVWLRNRVHPGAEIPKPLTSLQ